MDESKPVERKVLRKDTFNNDWYSPGAPKIKVMLWYFVNVLFVKPYYNPFSKVKIAIMRMFGARFGKGCIIKPGVLVKYPWNLEMGDYSALGEQVWVDNLVPVRLANHVTISQGAMLLTGNHDYKSTSHDLIVKEIVLEDGVWICAKAIVGPGVTCHSHSVLGVMSVATRDLDAYGIYSGNPAQFVRERVFR